MILLDLMTAVCEESCSPSQMDTWDELCDYLERTRTYAREEHALGIIISEARRSTWEYVKNAAATIDSLIDGNEMNANPQYGIRDSTLDKIYELLQKFASGDGG